MTAFIEQDPDVQSVSMSELLGRFEKAFRGKIHTNLVGVVEAFDSAKQTADVRPVVCFNYPNTDGTVEYVAHPVLADVPVMYDAGSGFVSYVPLSAGDFVTVHVMERSVDEWKAGNNKVEPRNLRRFDLSDAFCTPGPQPPDQAFTGLGTRMLIGEPGGMRIQIGDNGKITIGTSTTELLGVIDSLLTALAAFSLATSAAAVEPTLGPAATTLNTAITTVGTGIQALLQSIKGP